MADTTKLLVCTCGDCDDWLIGKDAAGSFIKCQTCDHQFPVTLHVPAHDKLTYQDAKPALARGRQMVPKAKK